MAAWTGYCSHTFVNLTTSGWQNQWRCVSNNYCMVTQKSRNNSQEMLIHLETYQPFNNVWLPNHNNKSVYILVKSFPLVAIQIAYPKEVWTNTAALLTYQYKEIIGNDNKLVIFCWLCNNGYAYLNLESSPFQYFTMHSISIFYNLFLDSL